VASTAAGCNQVANLSEFDNAHVVPSVSDASTKGKDAASTADAAHEDGQNTPGAEAGLDATLEAATGPTDDGGEDATLTEAGDDGGGEMEAATEVEAGEDAEVETEAGCVCSGYGATSTTCYGPCAPVCGAHFGDCNASSPPNPDDGCETYLDSLTSCRTSCGGTAAACSPTDVCNAGVCGAAQGLVVFTVPLTATGQGQRYADKPGTPWNLEGQTMFVRMYAPGATGGVVVVYLSDNTSASNEGPSVTVNLALLATGWRDVELPGISDEPAPFTAAQVKQITMEVRAGSDTAWTNPTVIYVDSVWSSEVTIDDTFDTSIGNMIPSMQLMITGSTLTWQDAVSPPVDGGTSDAATDGN
jgi:hypothetical protein